MLPFVRNFWHAAKLVILVRKLENPNPDSYRDESKKVKIDFVAFVVPHVRDSATTTNFY